MSISSGTTLTSSASTSCVMIAQPKPIRPEPDERDPLTVYLIGWPGGAVAQSSCRPNNQQASAEMALLPTP